MKSHNITIKKPSHEVIESFVVNRKRNVLNLSFPCQKIKEIYINSRLTNTYGFISPNKVVLPLRNKVNSVVIIKYQVKNV
jgi:hypothetical protein